MKKKRVFAGVILIGFGAYFLLQQSEILQFEQFFTWPTLLFIIGIAFLVQAYGTEEYASILPGVILTGFGIYFHAAEFLNARPEDDIGVFILIIALGFMMQYHKTKEGIVQGLLFLIISIALLFYEYVTNWFGLLESSIDYVTNFWPYILLAFGVYLLIAAKKS